VPDDGAADKKLKYQFTRLDPQSFAVVNTFKLAYLADESIAALNKTIRAARRRTEGKNANRYYSLSRYNTLVQTIRERTNRYRVRSHRPKSTPTPSQEKIVKSVIRVFFGMNWIRKVLSLSADEVASTRKIPLWPELATIQGAGN
jgi:hypothetical protein